MDLRHDQDLVDVVVGDGDNNDGAGAGADIGIGAAVRGKNDVDAFEEFVALVVAVFAGAVHFLTNHQQMLHDLCRPHPRSAWASFSHHDHSSCHFADHGLYRFGIYHPPFLKCCWEWRICS